MEKWGTVRAKAAVHERAARHPDGGTDPATAEAARDMDPEPREKRECTRRENRKRIFGRDGGDYDGGDYDGGDYDSGDCSGSGGGDGVKSEGRGTSRGADDAWVAGPDARAERQSHGPSYCGHHIMLTCAARREMRGRGAAPSPPEAMYSYSGGRGLPRAGARRQDDDDRGEAAGSAS